ncbi:growth differentiation factor 11, gdf11, putative [Ixodes scapularis]|uniref:Growth differentiation factor 11, gdf11, putative n=1 Tax=Ixodes scapularis TaxID=6945 RepID=B7P4V3_IXOSC|nr:growth differentiation factor 11, gdf11, putative [Ixodes scapularis]|eukprot:XP_002406488.1 growth differentiation factor 11, gdf11, putative [Ixodes scapularis]
MLSSVRCATALAVLAVACCYATTSSTTPADEESSPSGSNCTRCASQGESRLARLQAIKAQILSKLGMQRAPNVTRSVLPGIPPLHRLLDRYDAGLMQADAPFVPGEQYDEEDDYHVAAEKVISFGMPGQLWCPRRLGVGHWCESPWGEGGWGPSALGGWWADGC